MKAFVGLFNDAGTAPVIPRNRPHIEVFDKPLAHLRHRVAASSRNIRKGRCWNKRCHLAHPFVHYMYYRKNSRF